MAYWLHCQSCKQWSKSTTPLSDDKSCAFCSKPFVTVKPMIRSIPDKGTAEQSKELQIKADILETAKIPEKHEMSEITEPSETSATLEMIEIPETDEELESPETEEVLEEFETPEISEAEEVQEESGTFTALDIEEIPDMADGSGTLGTRETPETSEASEARKMTRTHETFLQQKRRMRNLH